MAETVRRHFDRLAKEWHEKYSAGGSMAGRGGRLLGSLRMALPDGGGLLDFGCGSGSLSVRFAAAGYAVTAVDSSAEMIGMARRLDTRRSVQFSQVEEAAGGLPFRDGSFDGVVASSVFEYLADAAATARELRRVVRPGGALVATVPNPLHPVRWAEAVEKRLRQSGMGGRDAMRREYLELSRNRFGRGEWERQLLRAEWRMESVTGRHASLLLLVARAVGVA